MTRKHILFRFLSMSVLLSAFAFAAHPPAGWAKEGEYKFVTGFMQEMIHPYGVALSYMKEKMAERTNGRVQIEIYPNSQLGSEGEMLQNMLAGREINMLQVAAGNIAPFIPEMDFFSLPYLFSGWESFTKAMRGGDVANIIRLMLAKKDLVQVSMFTSGDRNLLLRNKKVMTPADCKGLKMRVWESPIVKTTWAAQGTNPIVVAYVEAYTALQTGVVDAAENDFTTFVRLKWGETSKYLAMTHHLFMPNPVFVSRKAWEKLPVEIQTIFLQTGREASEIMFNEQRQLETKYRKQLEEAGLEIYDIDRAPFVAATEQVRQDFAKKHNLEWIFDYIKEYQ